MIKITENLFIDNDEYGYVLKKKYKLKKGKDKGQYSFRSLCYHTRLEDMITSTFDFLTKEQLKKKELTLNKTLKLLKDIKTDLEKAVKENKNGNIG